MKNNVLSHLLTVPLLQKGDTVTCALSGGADSVAMTHLLWSLRDSLGITVRACHLNHHLRGEQSDADAAFCADFCEKLGIPLTIGDADVAARMAQTGESMEEAARACRYAFFAEQPGLVATAHNANDNLETVLMALVRGTGLKGLCGIPPKRANIIRPLLNCTREEILAYLSENGLSYREDETNAKDDCLRNRLRHRVVPLLKEENPSLFAAASKMAFSLREDETYLQQKADALLAAADRGKGRYLAKLLRDAPTPVRRRAIRSVLSDLGVPKLAAAHLLAVESLLMHAHPSKRVSLPAGVIASRRYDLLCFAAAPSGGVLAAITVPCPFDVILSDGARLALVPADDGARIRADALNGALLIRPRKTGDALRLSGGRKSLKSLMIDRKIPRQDRENCPVLECDGRVIAAMPIGIDADALARDGERGFRLIYEPNQKERDLPCKP